jgi:putative ABC transport system substrate-binding protein
MKYKLATLAVVLGLALIAAPRAADAQQAGKVYQVGLFHVGLDHVPPSLDGLREGLKLLGYDVDTSPAPKVSTIFEGKNIRLDWRNVADEAAARETAKTFVRDQVDLIVAFESQAVRAAQAATADIPVVFLHVADPIAEGFVRSFSRPGGNLTGLEESFEVLLAKRMELLREIVPRLRRLLVLSDPLDPASGRARANVRDAGAMLKLQLVEQEASNRGDIERVFRSLRPADAQGAIVASSSLVTNFPSLIVRLALEKRLPIVWHRKASVEQGALLSYGVNFHLTGRDAARYVDKILKGMKPADLPVERVSRFELVINLKTAKALGLTIPQAVLLRADQVIE